MPKVITEEEEELLYVVEESDMEVSEVCRVVDDELGVFGLDDSTRQALEELLVSLSDTGGRVSAGTNYHKALTVLYDISPQPATRNQIQTPFHGTTSMSDLHDWGYVAAQKKPGHGLSYRYWITEKGQNLIEEIGRAEIKKLAPRDLWEEDDGD